MLCSLCLSTADSLWLRSTGTQLWCTIALHLFGVSYVEMQRCKLYALRYCFDVRTNYVYYCWYNSISVITIVVDNLMTEVCMVQIAFTNLLKRSMFFFVLLTASGVGRYTHVVCNEVTSLGNDKFTVQLPVTGSVCIFYGFSHLMWWSSLQKSRGVVIIFLNACSCWDRKRLI
jgi:hypothetical protein